MQRVWTQRTGEGIAVLHPGDPGRVDVCEAREQHRQECGPGSFGYVQEGEPAGGVESQESWR